MFKNKVRSSIYGVLLAIGSVFLFVGGPDYYSCRSLKHFWDVGHIAYFALFADMLARWRFVARMSLPGQWTLILVITLLLGASIEILQNGTSRSPDMGDVLRDITGSLIALVFGTLGPRLQPSALQYTARVSVLVLLLILMWPLGKSLIDEAIAREQFPVLSDFETPFEIDRWEGNAQLSVETMHNLSQGKVLKLSLTTDKYSGASLKYFDGKWASFNTLNISLYNPDVSFLKITCRIHDIQHADGDEEYEDRFNRSFLLVQGWNHIEIDLNQVMESPANRHMDINRILGLGLFATSLSIPRIIYLDNVRLAP
jgi:hypothetical protein